VVGGGAVGTRKALALAEAGASVRVIAPRVTAELEAAEHASRVEIAREAYRSEALGDESLVFAATGSREVNLRVAADARMRGKLVNVADAPAEGDFDTMAIHRSGDVTIAVSAGGVPGAAARIRDAVAARFDARYDHAVSALRELRLRLLARGGEDWRTAAPALLGEDFCEAVESGSFPDKVAAWR